MSARRVSAAENHRGAPLVSADLRDADRGLSLRALADYAEQHGSEFLLVESIAKVGESFRALDLHDAKVREAVRAFEGGKVTALYESEVARDYL